MSQPGIGAMLHALSGGSEKDPKEYYGKTIRNALMGKADTRYDGEMDALLIHFDDECSIAILDAGQSCCESRYITCDDNPKDLVGQKLKAITTKEGPEVVGEYGDTHEQVFIEIQGDSSSITICTHNEHNGYYGGFGLTVKEIND